MPSYSPSTGVTSEQPVRVCFAYQHEYRVVDVSTVRMTKDGNWIVTGVDVDKGEYRSFRVDRIQNKIKILDVLVKKGS